MKKGKTALALIFALTLFWAIFPAGDALAHCDSMDGPVIRDAREALETGNINLVLIWVGKDAEPEIREAFRKTIDVRELGPQARELADMYFFETLVRVHRAGEGVAYTGLKPSGTVIDPGLLAADEAIEKGSAAELTRRLGEDDRAEINKRFKRLQELKDYDKNDVQAGREYVESYVSFIHYVEELFQADEKSPDAHGGDAGHNPVHHGH